MASSTYFAERSLAIEKVILESPHAYDEIAAALEDGRCLAYSGDVSDLGAIRLRFRDFLLGTFFGMLPGAVATTVFGDQLQSALRDPARINYWVIAGVVVVFAVGIYFVRRWFGKQFEKQGTAAMPGRQPT